MTISHEIELEVDELFILIQGHELQTDFRGWVTFTPKKEVIRIEQLGEWQTFRWRYARMEVDPKLSKDLYHALEAGILKHYADEINQAIDDWAEENGYGEPADDPHPPRLMRDYF
jgi:hypothetical protein